MTAMATQMSQQSQPSVTSSWVRAFGSFDGDHGWIRDRGGVHDADAMMLHGVETTLKRDTVSLLLAAEAGTVRARATRGRPPPFPG